jgi:hypothetical protein
MDANDATPGIAGPSGEGIADIYTALRLNDSCIGRNFRATACTGFGDPCNTCTGVRDIDYLKRASGQPHDYSWSNSNCGGSVHCVGSVYSEAVWSLWKRQLPTLYGYDDNTAHEIVNRLTYIGAGATSTWFSGGPPNGGCSASGGYKNFLAADDDDGNLNNGTPHMQAIYNAFNDQEIACQDLTVQDSGCGGTPTDAPNVTATPSNNSVDLSWGSVTGATEYEVFRTEGVFACDFGKVKLGTTTGTTWSDSGLQNGRDYSYIVVPKGSADACFGPASSCDTVAPAAGPGFSIDSASAESTFSGGDSDAYLDNCEAGSTTFEIVNNGLGSLTNVSIVGVTPSNGGVAIGITSVTPSTLAQGATAIGSFSYTAGGTFMVEVTADEMASSKFVEVTVFSTETDLQLVASRTYSFESDAEGWTTVQGTFDRSSVVGGSHGSWYEQSSANLENQCDQIMSPVMVFSETTTLTLWNSFDIEPIYTNGQWYDRANVGVVPSSTGSRTAVSPDGGRLYNASGVNGNCGTSGQAGWADTASTWVSSSWSAAALGSAGLADDAVQLDIRYGTDELIQGDGFRFDQVTVTDVWDLVADAQEDNCEFVCTENADCDNGLFCDGAEICNAGICEAGTPPACDDGAFCNGAETCNEGTDQCDTGTAPACDDGAFCNGTETCNEGTDSCDAGTAPACDDGAFCNGTEMCDEGADACVDGSPPTCAEGEICDVGTDSCVPLAGDMHIQEIFTGTQNAPAGRGNKNGTATVTIFDENGNPVGAGYEVVGQFQGTFNEMASAITGDTGVAVITTTGFAKNGLVIDFCVTNVAGTFSGALDYDPADNVVDCSGTATPPPDPDPLTGVHVENITTGQQGIGGGEKQGTAEVTIFGDNNMPQAGYTVTGQFSGDFNESDSASTNASGVASFTTSGSKKGKVNVSFCVDTVTGGETYYPSDNASPAYSCTP